MTLTDTAYAFPGQGAQRVGMGVELATRGPAAAVFEEASDALGVDLLRLCREGPEAELQRTEIAQPTLLTVSLATLAVARPHLPEPRWVAGQSLGEYTALVAAGAMELADAVRLVRARGTLMAEATAGRDVAMAAVMGLDADAVRDLCGSVGHAGCCWTALLNGKRQTVVSGDRAAVDLLVQVAERSGATATRLAVSSSFHTPLMEPVAAELGRLLDDIPIRSPQVPVISNVTAAPVTDPARIREALLHQLTRPVRWTDTMAHLIGQGMRTLIEFGPGRVLCSLARQADRSLDTIPISDATTLSAAVRRFAAPVSAPGVVPVPAGRARAYRAAGWWTDELLGDAIRAVAVTRPATWPALVDGSLTITHGELPAAVERVASALAARGLGAGDRVVVQLAGSPAFVVLLLALWRIGAVAVMALPGFGEHELRHVLTASEAAGVAVPRRLRRRDHLGIVRALVRTTAGRPVTLITTGPGGDGDVGDVDLDALLRGTGPGDVAAPVAPVGPDDLALLLLSGGTTGRPKLIPRLHRDYRYNAAVSAEMAAVGPETVYLAALPVAHNFALGCPGALGTLLNGGTVAFPAGPMADAVLDAADEYGATMTAVVPTLAQHLVEAVDRRGRAPQTLALVQVGGARLAPAASRRLRATLGVRVQQVYGMAEGLLNFTRLDDADDVVDTTQGRPASPGDDVRIVDGSGAEVADGAIGELLTRGPYTIAGYYRPGPEQALSFDAEGYFRTGDLVRRHPSGNLVVEGRVKDVINRGGEKVSAVELEEALLSYPGVGHVAAFGVPDEVTGESVWVAVTADTAGAEPAPELTRLRGHLAGQGFAGYKLPEHVLVVPALPLTGVGKVDKNALRALALQEAT